MLDSSLISVVVPVYGVQDYIAQCIDSLLSQRYTKIEIILVNDGSVDRSADMCDSYASLDRRIRVVHKPNRGLVSARKAGVAVATGEYLGFVDGDDWVGSDFFGSLYDHAASASADLVISGHIREFFGKCEEISPRNAAGFYDRDGVLEALLPTAIYNGIFFQHGVSTYVWNKLFRREQAARFVNDIDDEIVMGEDAALTYPYLASSHRVVVCGAGSYFYRQRSNSIVKSVPDIAKEYYRLSALFRYLRRKFEGSSYSESVSNQLRYYFYAQVLVRSGAVVRSHMGSRYLIPFPGLDRGQKIVVYSSGSFGQHLVGAIRPLEGFQLVGWIDEDDHESQRSGLPVSSIDSISTLDFDLVLIAAIDSEYAKAVAKRLEAKGIKRAKISLLDVDFERLDEHLREIGFDTRSFSFSPRIE
jgi:glycosyltransferase involved in cell wall biosynthesis